MGDDPATSAGSSRRPRRGPLLWAMLLALPLLLALAVYLGGFLYLCDDAGFSERRVTCRWRDLGLATALAQLFPGQDIRFAGDHLAGMSVSMDFEDEQERDVVRLLSGEGGLRIRRSGDAIVVSGQSWLWRRYDALDGRLYLLGGSPWRRKRPLER
jgi:hypothetical protein